MENSENSNIPSVWLYLRGKKGSEKIKRQTVTLRNAAAEQGYTVCHVSADERDGLVLFRPGLQQMLRAVRSGTTQNVMVRSVSSISSNRRVVLRVLRQLQRNGARLLTQEGDLRYELYCMGVESPLLRSAAQYDDFVPW
ncbi:MAG: recombinase family protein [Gemmiger sp.]|nr:recombinase family protein [Gemmiger sp.]